jgi:hypothetical protein
VLCRPTLTLKNFDEYLSVNTFGCIFKGCVVQPRSQTCFRDIGEAVQNICEDLHTMKHIHRSKSPDGVFDREDSNVDFFISSEFIGV